MTVLLSLQYTDINKTGLQQNTALMYSAMQVLRRIDTVQPTQEDETFQTTIRNLNSCKIIE